MVDCEWEGSGFRVQSSEPVVSGQWSVVSGQKQSESRSSSHQPPATSHFVSLGDTFALASGLMEITYDTGAKVILQGPMTYGVESAAGGYLAVGKLTGKVEKKGEGGRQKAKGSNPQSLVSNPLFSIRTPTATVTDLGTEFGVEVSRDGLTMSHVFRGSVKVQRSGVGAENKGDAIVLRENESVQTQKIEEPKGVDVVLRRVAANAERFVRDLPPAKKRLPLHVIAYFRLGEDDPDAAPGRPAGARTINHVGSRHLEKHGSIRYTADTAAPGSSLAMSFEEPGAHFTCSDLYLSVCDYFILEAWVRAKRVKDVPTVIVYNGRGDPDGYGLMTISRRWQFMFCGVCFGDSGVPCEVGKWTHLALVCQRGRSQLWVNGRPAGQVVNVLPNVPGGPIHDWLHTGEPEPHAVLRWPD